MVLLTHRELQGVKQIGNGGVDDEQKERGNRVDGG